MGVFEVSIFLLLLPLLSWAASFDCPYAYCGPNFYDIQFPFRLLGQQPPNCGYPGFNLDCIGQSMLLINLPSSGEFGVRSIDYSSQVIRIYDQVNNCLPARLLNFDLSGSPFSAAYYRNYTLLSCPNEVDGSHFTNISCLSNSTHSTLATSSTSLVRSMTGNQTSCQIIGSLRAPVSGHGNQDVVSSDLNEDVYLTWGSPACGDCETLGGTCGFANSSTLETTCFNYNQNGLQPGAHIFRIIALAMALPAMIGSIAIACFMCNKERMSGTTTRNPRNTSSNAATLTPEAASMPTGIIGLDQVTIESYTKVVLGESKRLPGLNNDATCPICLADYHAKETVRCIPECRHSFHADCIDEWLKMKGTCPVCRNTPTPVRADS